MRKYMPKKFFNRRSKFSKTADIINDTKEYINNWSECEAGVNELIEAYTKACFSEQLNVNVNFGIIVGMITATITTILFSIFDYLNPEWSIVIKLICVAILCIVAAVLSIFIILVTYKCLFNLFNDKYNLFILPYEKNKLKQVLKDKYNIEI